MTKRRQAREYCLQGLYLADAGMTGEEISSAFERILVGLDPETANFARRLFSGSLSSLEKIDSAISAKATNWKLSRMPAVDRNILRLAAYELFVEPETPVAAVIDEAIELAKKYSTDDSPAFVNGILDQLKSLRQT